MKKQNSKMSAKAAPKSKVQAKAKAPAKKTEAKKIEVKKVEAKKADAKKADAKKVDAKKAEAKKVVVAPKKEVAKKISKPIPAASVEVEVDIEIQETEISEVSINSEPTMAMLSEGGMDEMSALGKPGVDMNSSAIKNFRHHHDMENFYRFIHENDLRHEALEIIDAIIVQKAAQKKLKLAKSRPN